VYAKPKFDPLIDSNPNVPLAHAALHFNGTSYRVNHGRELDQHAVSGRLDDTAPMFFDFRIDQRLPMPLQLSVRAFLIHAHETAVPGHICSQNGGEPSLQVLATQSTPPDRGRQLTPRVAVAKGELTEFDAHCAPEPPGTAPSATMSAHRVISPRGGT
jgi:hypothetical protein